MGKDINPSIINLAAAIITLVAVIIPIAFIIWNKAKEGNYAHEIKSLSLLIISVLFYAAGLILGQIYGPSGTTLVFISIAFAAYCGYFYNQKSEITRGSIIYLILQAMIVLATLNLYFSVHIYSIFQKISE